MINCKKCDFLSNAPCQEHEQEFIRVMEENLKGIYRLRQEMIKACEENLCMMCGCDLGPQDPMDHHIHCCECASNLATFQDRLDEEKE